MRNLSAIVLRSVDGSCVLSLSCTYGSEHRTGIVNSPDGGFAFVDNIFCPQRSRLSRRIVCHVFIPLRALTIALHSAIFLVVASRNWNMMTRSGEKILTCMAPSRVISKLGHRNEVPFHVPMIIANGHEEPSRDERHLFIPEMEFWRKNETCSEQAHSHVDFLRMYGHFGRILSPPWDAVHVDVDEHHGADAASDLFQPRFW